MANYITKLGDVQVLLEAPVGGAFAKQDLDIQPDPDRAIENVLETIALLAQHAGQRIGPAMRHTGAAFEMSFAVRADNKGLVMISEHSNVGQFQCTLKFPPMRPAAKKPAPAPKAIPQRRDQD